MLKNFKEFSRVFMSNAAVSANVASLGKERVKPLKLLVLVNLLGKGGGTIRAIQSIEYYSKIGYQLATLFDYFNYIWSIRDGFEEVIRVYKKYGIVPIGCEKPAALIHIVDLFPRGKRWLYGNLGEFLYKFGLKKRVILAESYKPDIIISFHENIPYLRLAYEMKGLFFSPAISFLQSTPFYEDKSRVQNIEKACLLHRYMLLKGSWRYSILRMYPELLGIRKHPLKESIEKIEALLKSLDMVIAISKGIPVEMGRAPRNLVYMDPGVSLDNNTLDLIEKVKTLNIPRGDYVAFIGRPMDCQKGLVEALIAFKYLLKEFPTLRLFIIGATSPRFKRSVYHFLRESLGISESKVIFTNFLSREDLYKLIRGACLVLYPSHAEAYPFAVLESLMLETPVVAYRIPALQIYYGNVERKGIWLVNEGDIEKLVGTAIEVLELERRRDLKVEFPRIRPMDDIMREEVELINRVLK
jgi:glycosyltransferase involved in cell wall biosynthesis